MIEDFFDHACDIYHLRREAGGRGYGLPDEGGERFSYPDSPDIGGLPCHFGVKGGGIALYQREPQQDMESRIKLAVPAGTDIRLDDKVVSASTGYEYRAEVPRDIRGHHVYVWVRRVWPQAV